MSNFVLGVDIDLDDNQLLNARVENGAASPTSSVAKKGRLFFNTTTSKLQYDNGSVIQDVANLNDVSGLLDFKGGYDAATNTPAINGGAGVLKGDYYVVTLAGTFLGVQLEVGDSLFANQDAPTLISQWTLIQTNVVNPARKYSSPSTSVGGGSPVTFTHNLGSSNVIVQCVRVSTGAIVQLGVNNFTSNTVDITKAGANYNVIVTVIG